MVARQDKARPALPRALAARIPFYYGWIILACLCCAGFARQGPGIATFSIFVEPLTREFGWSRAAVSGAVSLGGVLAALISPLIGPVLDRRGSRLVLCLAVLINGAALLLLSFTSSLAMFYLLFCVARMNWAGPFDLGIYAALNNWFLARRAAAASIATMAQMLGLVVMPLLAQFAISHDGWRAGWVALGAAVLIVGFLPVWLFLVRRPEDIGLEPDPAGPPARAGTVDARAAEPRFSRRQALGSPSFWLLILFTVTIYPVQAGVSLHQASHLVQRGLDPTTAAFIVSSFSLSSGIASVACGFLPRGLPLRFVLAAAAALIGIGTLLMPGIGSASAGYLAAALFGAGVGGLLTLLPVAWADYFGRANYGAIRGLALSVQVLAQATGPLISGALYDWSGTYAISLYSFAALAAVSILAALLARQPRPSQKPSAAHR